MARRVLLRTVKRLPMTRRALLMTRRRLPITRNLLLTPRSTSPKPSDELPKARNGQPIPPEALPAQNQMLLMSIKRKFNCPMSLLVKEGELIVTAAESHPGEMTKRLGATALAETRTVLDSLSN